jgi:DNA-binding NarL/FixJ family response regulator
MDGVAREAYLTHTLEWSYFAMITAASSPCRMYIVYNHGLFAQGVRSILEKQSGVQIVGMESNGAKALKAVRSLRPEVILVEEPTKNDARWPFLQLAVAGRVVTLSLEHPFATVHDQHRIPASDPADLVKAIRGARSREQQFTGLDPQHGEKAIATRPEAGRNGKEDQTGRETRVRRALKEVLKKPETIPRVSRGKSK